MDRNILFLCTGNSARSQMGEAFLQKGAGDCLKVFSAGLEPKKEVFPPVIEVMKEVGIDISKCKPKGVGLFLGKIRFEKVIIVCGDAEKRCPSIFGSAQRLFWPFEDPAAATGSKEEVLAVCRRVRDQISHCVEEFLKEHLAPDSL